MAIKRLTAPFADVPRQPGEPFPAAAHLSLRLKTFRHILRVILPPRPGATLVDLGAGAGQFSRIASRLGYAVTAIDARPRWTLAGEDARAAGAPDTPAGDRITSITTDLRDFDRLHEFDVVLAVGVLYHLPLSDQLALLRRSAGRPLVIDTELYDSTCIPADRAWRFRPAPAVDGYEGALCRETGQAWSSAADPEGFWFTEDSLLHAFRDAGRSEVTILDPPYHSAFGPRRWYILHG
nr:methyltransferase domain-containing protein [Pararoseomonas baculiformis]